MPCGPTVPVGKTRQDDLGLDPFSYSHGTALMQGFANMAMIFSMPMRAAMVVAGEAIGDSGTERD